MAIYLDRLESNTANRNDPFLFTLAEDTDHPAAQVDVLHIETDELAHPQA